MQKLILHHDTPFSGDFKVAHLNFLFVFQVNCPGCFLYGIPLVDELYKEFGKEVSFLGLSTAFEDFEYNTIENTKSLVSKNELVGETKKALKKHGLNSYPYPIEFPIAMDKKSNDSFDFNHAAKQICISSTRYQTANPEEQSLFLANVVHYLKNQPELSLTFTLNQLKGTPTFLVFDDTYTILYHQFGHIEHNIIQSKLSELIKKAT